MTEERIVAIGLLTQRHVDALGGSLARIWPIEDAPSFAGLLQAIDDADRGSWRAPDQSSEVPSRGHRSED